MPSPVWRFALVVLLMAIAQAPAAAAAERWVVILVGLGGDADYDKKYAEVTDRWQRSFQEEWKIPADHLIRPPSPLTAANIEQTLGDLAKKVQPDDSFWLLTLGHGDYDGQHARFHVSGRDPIETDWPRWLADVKCREQVLWLTHSASGWLVKPLSKPGRVVIAATEAAAEVNETEFPYALAKVLAGPAKDSDADGDGQVSLAELFPKVVAATNERFTMDKRLPTEHAQLDDDGDGRGSEELQSPNTDDAAAKNAKSKDGALSRTILLPWPVKN